MNISQDDVAPGSLQWILNEHDGLSEEQMLKRKSSKEWKALQEQIVALRQAYNDKVGREMFKID